MYISVFIYSLFVLIIYIEKLYLCKFIKITKKILYMYKMPTFVYNFHAFVTFTKCSSFFP